MKKLYGIFFLFVFVSFASLVAGIGKNLKTDSTFQKKALINNFLNAYKEATNNKYYYLSAISPAFACLVFIIEPHAQDNHESDYDRYKKLSELIHRK